MVLYKTLFTLWCFTTVLANPSLSDVSIVHSLHVSFQVGDKLTFYCTRHMKLSPSFPSFWGLGLFKTKSRFFLKMHAILFLIFSAAQFWTHSDVWRWATENFTTFGYGKRATEIAEKFEKWAPVNFATLGHRKRAAEIKERAPEIFSVLKSTPAKACSKKCTAGSNVPWTLKRLMVIKIHIWYTP